MSLVVWLGIIVFSGGLWWFGFVATKQMRLDKNKERTLLWEKMAAEQKKRRQAEALASESNASESQTQTQDTNSQDSKHQG